ncbi:hypothetical protein SAMN05421664_0771 [Chryseobacterium soldanellicola]|uniref:Uncharacterized protein n=1 Tax=Chryseobacterium soldanellicola TaxID=311333 RepID=A0A1H0YJI9_9FLAO|nr:hypothetical protein [Chryseobacterium soldanellicola]SDQ15415.1 hypothetical protein SAMN05421664_0771 [Chryseobacterium soldanellicola]
MKKIFLYILAGSLCFTACKKDDDVATYVEPEDISVQNTYDDQSIQKFLDENYLDTQGNIKPFSSTDASDDNYKKLSQLNPVTLPSGVVYIMRDSAQPDPGTAIGNRDIIKLMLRSKTYLAANTDGNVAFISGTDFVNTIDGTGSPIVDPTYYYIANKNPLIVNATTDAAKQKSYYMVEGLNEALQKFKAFDLSNGASYNLQGVIIVPSRAAFARDAHYNYTGYSFRNRSFVFNFQVYKTEARPADQD